MRIFFAIVTFLAVSPLYAGTLKLQNVHLTPTTEKEMVTVQTSSLGKIAVAICSTHAGGDVGKNDIVETLKLAIDKNLPVDLELRSNEASLNAYSCIVSVQAIVH